MPTYVVTDPETGRKLKLTGDSPPTEAELEEIFAAQAGESSDPQPSGLRRQAGLTARHAVEGSLMLPGMAANAVGAVANKGLEMAGADYRFPDQNQLISDTLTQAGLPTPEGSVERVVGDASRALTAGGGVAAAGRMLANSAGPVVSGVGNVLTERLGTQAAAEIAAAGAAGAAREGGAPAWLQNTLGIAAGVATPMAAPVSQSAARLAGAVTDAFTRPGQERIAGNVLRDQAADVTRTMDNLTNPRPTVTQQGTGPVSLDSGLLAFHRGIQNTDPSGAFPAAASQANSQRQRILSALAPDDIGALKAERNAVTGPMRERALSQSDGKVVDVDAVRRVIDGIASSPKGKRRTVRQSMDIVRKDLEGVTDARSLYEVRKEISDAMEGRLRNPDRSDMKLAKSELWYIKNEIDQRIEEVAPGFIEYLEKYAAMSRNIDNQATVQGIQSRSTVATPTVSGGQVEDVLSQAKFRRAVRAEREAGNLPEEMLTVLESIADDLDLAVTPNAFRPAGSDTAQNLTVANLVGQTLGGQTDNPAIRALLRPVEFLTKASDEQVQAILVDAMLDPDMARLLLADANERAMAEFGWNLQNRIRASAAGTGVGLAAEDSQPPTQ